jgi:glycosyltransferase involved in cell wall biosynthesis
MKILQVAPLWEDVPPPAYGGTEAVVSLLTETLVSAGHDVTLAASGASKTRARLLSVHDRSLRAAENLQDRNPYDWMHLATALSHAREYDIVHNHAGELAMAMSTLIEAPMLTTMHCLTTPDTQFVWNRYRGAYNTISRAQRRSICVEGPARFVGHVYNSIDVETFPFCESKGDDLLFLSRIAPEKGADKAVEVAKMAGRRLILAGKVDPADRRYFAEVMKDLIDGEQIVFVGEADAARKRELYANAYCTLMPIQWEEPFGLVMPESMACGTPVIALRRGSAPELIEHGKTGFVVDTLGEMAEAVEDVSFISPADCRRDVEERFAPEMMTRQYVRLYGEILDWHSRSRTHRVVDTHSAGDGRHASVTSVTESPRRGTALEAS